jgi:hypothetical protein
VNASRVSAGGSRGAKRSIPGAGASRRTQRPRRSTIRPGRPDGGRHRARVPSACGHQWSFGKILIFIFRTSLAFQLRLAHPARNLPAGFPGWRDDGDHQNGCRWKPASLLPCDGRPDQLRHDHDKKHAVDGPRDRHRKLLLGRCQNQGGGRRRHLYAFWPGLGLQRPVGDGSPLAGITRSGPAPRHKPRGRFNDVRGPARPLLFWRGVARRAAPRGCSAGVWCGDGLFAASGAACEPMRASRPSATWSAAWPVPGAPK